MSATISKSSVGYLISIGVEHYQKYNLADAIDFCKTLGFKVVISI